MRTVFVNPRRRTKRTARKRKPASRRRKRNTSPMAANPRRRRRRSYRRKPVTRRRRSRRRNAGITSFTDAGARGNPLILSNPRRRTRRRNPRLNLKTIINKTLTYGGGGALGYAVNQFGLSNIENDWLRRGAQLATAVVGSMFLRGELGAAFAGSTLYPLMADVAMYTGLIATPTEADLDELAADLDTALGEDTEELYIDDFEPMEDGADEPLVAW